MNWEVEQLRFTIFPTQPIVEKKSFWWEELFEILPEKVTILPKNQVYQEEGVIENYKIILITGTSNVHLTLNHPNLTIGFPNKFLTIGKFAKVASEFENMILKWMDLESFPLINRIAFGSVLLNPVKNKKEGYKKLSDFIPALDIDVDNSSDLFYQINRLRKSETKEKDLIINRLSKWSVMKLLLGNTPVLQSSNDIVKIISNYSCRLELDINTVPNRQKAISRRLLPKILEELLKLGKEISIEGDIP